MADADMCTVVVLVHNMDGEGFEDLEKLIKTSKDDARQQTKEPVVTVKLLSEALQMAKKCCCIVG
jgi:hypothetical protein